VRVDCKSRKGRRAWFSPGCVLAGDAREKNHDIRPYKNRARFYRALTNTPCGGATG
jgi:hypothetical protein